MHPGFLTTSSETLAILQGVTKSCVCESGGRIKAKTSTGEHDDDDDDDDE